MADSHKRHRSGGGNRYAGGGNKKQPEIKVNRRDLNFLLNDVAFEQSGFIEKETENEVITQQAIVENVDLFSAQKYFDLNLDQFGPYRLNYTRNGRSV